MAARLQFTIAGKLIRALVRYMVRANSPVAVLLSSALHAVLAAGLAVCVWLTMEHARVSAPIVLVAKDNLFFPGTDGEPSPALRNLDPVVFTPSRVRAVPIPDRLPEAPVPVMSQPALGRTARALPVTKPEPSTRPPVGATADGRRKVATALPVPAVPQIDGEGIARELMREANTGSGRQETAAHVAAPWDLQNRLIALLRAAHRMPPAVDRLLVARVAFELKAGGQLAEAQIVKTSGDVDYDRSVLAAFTRVAAIGAVPAGCAGKYVIDFRMTE